MAQQHGMSEGTRVHHLPSGVIRVVVPARIASDLGRMQGITKEILGELGCGGCHSGYDLRFEQENQFIINEQGQIAR